MALAFSKSGRKGNKKILELLSKSTVLILAVMILILYLYIDNAVKFFIPSCIGGLNYFMPSVIGSLGFSFISCVLALNVMNKNLVNLTSLIVITMLTYGVYYFDVFSFKDVIEIIWLKNAIFFSYGVFITVYTYYELQKT